MTFFPRWNFEFRNKIVFDCIPSDKINSCKIFWTKVTPAAAIFLYFGISREQVILHKIANVTRRLYSVNVKRTSEVSKANNALPYLGKWKMSSLLPVRKAAFERGLKIGRLIATKTHPAAVHVICKSVLRPDLTN